MNERTAPHYYLHIRSGGWQWRIEPHAIVELRHELTKETVAEVPVSLAVHALTHFVTGAHITAAFLTPAGSPLAALESARAESEPLPMVALEKSLREARAGRRRARGRRSGDT